MQTIEEYLVALKFAPDQAGLAKFNATLADVGKKMSTTVGGLAGDFFKLQFTLTSGMVAIGSAAVGAMASFADFDKQMKLGSMTALMGKGAYTELNEALKMAGVTLAQASWDSESHARVLENMRLVHQLNMALGPDAEANAKKIRDFQNQFHQLGEELKYLSFAIGNDLFAKLFGGGDAQKALQKFNEWLLNNLPKLADEISTDLVPIMRDLAETGKDVGLVFKDAFAIFQEITGVLSGDTSLQTTEVSLESVAKTAEHVVHWVDDLVKSFLHLEEAILHLNPALLSLKDLEFLGGAALMTGTGRGLAIKGLKGLFGMGGAEAAAGGVAGEAAAGGAGIALAPLAAVGAGGVGIYELFKHRDAVEAWNTRFLQSIGRLPKDDGTTASITLPPGVVDAVKWMESRGHQFDKNGNVLKSSAGALGVMQLEPATAKALGVDPMNEADNVRGGTMYLQQLWARYHDIDKVLASYNLGPTALDRLIRRHGASYQEYLPAETRNYIKNGESRIANNTGGDTYNLVVHAQGADANQVAGLVITRLQDQNAQSARFSQAKMTGQTQ